MAEVDLPHPLAALRPLREVVESALAASDWLDPVKDGAVIELARYYAGLVDGAVTSGNPLEIQKALAVSGPNLHKALTSLGMTPAARGSVKGEEAPAADPFDELRKRRSRQESKAAKEA